MGALDGLFPSLAQNLLSTLGGKCNIEEVSDGTFDPLNSTRTGESKTVYSDISCSPPEPYNQFNAADARIKQGDVKFLVPSVELPKKPQEDWFIVYNSIRYRIIVVGETTSGQKSVVYEIAGRR